MIKQIYGALEFTDREIKLVVGEFYNTRFNIIRVEKEPCKGIEDFEIKDREAVKKSVTNIIRRANELIGASIERVILIIPSVNFKRFPLKVNVKTANGIVSKNDINRAVKKAMKTSIDRDVMIINAVCVKYTCNGISTRRIPEKEISEDLIVDIDLLCADKAITFDYVSVLEECGVQILDISLDMFAVCKEAALFEQTVNQNIILLKIDYETTTLALISKGKLVNCEILYNGLDSILKKVNDKYHLPYNVIDRLVKYNTTFTPNEFSDDSIFAWKNNEGVSNSISESELSDTVKEATRNLAVEIKETCNPILNSGQTNIVVVGEGAKMDALVKMISDETKVNAKTYFPETIGIRDSAYVTLLGSFYGYRDMLQINDNMQSSINLFQFSELVEKKTIDNEEESITARVKNLFEPKKREEL